MALDLAECPDCGMPRRGDDIAAAINKAVKDEREACARLVETMPYPFKDKSWWNIDMEHGHDAAVFQLAGAIRARKAGEE